MSTASPRPRRRPDGRRRSTSAGHAPSRTPATKPATASGLDLEAAFAATAAAGDAREGADWLALGVPQRLVTALERRGLREPFAIQARTIPDSIAGRDLLGRGQTGSGKTLAFGVPLLARLAGGPRRPGEPRGLVLVPTRELAEQVTEQLSPLGHAVDLRLTTVVGGASMHRQIQSLQRGVDVVVATPGRLLDLLERRECRLGSVEITVLDEADHMADLGFLPAVTKLLDATPAGGQRLLFSATLDRGVDRLVAKYLTDPAAHAVAPAASPVETMDHRAFVLERDHKLPVLQELALRPARTLLFVRTKHGADRLAKQLRKGGAGAEALHGDLSQNARRRALDAFSSGRSRVLVATDVAARGIHVDDLDLVVHVDPPADHKDYLHRSGRTARAGATGTVLSLLLPEQRREAERMHERAGVEARLVQVQPGHPAVREIATSGETVVPVELPAAAAAPGRPSGTSHAASGTTSRAPRAGHGARREDARGEAGGRQRRRAPRQAQG